MCPDTRVRDSGAKRDEAALGSSPAGTRGHPRNGCDCGAGLVGAEVRHAGRGGLAGDAGPVAGERDHVACNDVGAWLTPSSTRQLRRPVGGTDVMREQLRRLIEFTELPNVTLQVVSFGVGGLTVTNGGSAALRSRQFRAIDGLPGFHAAAGWLGQAVEQLFHVKAESLTGSGAVPAGPVTAS